MNRGPYKELVHVTSVVLLVIFSQGCVVLMGPLDHWYWLLPIGVALGLGCFAWYRARKQRPQRQFESARAMFQHQRADLLSQFFQVASTSGKPRGLRWKQCQWSDLIAWVRDKQTGQLMALVGVTIAFEAIEGGDMEGLEAVGNLRNASAVFFFQDGQWQTGGRVIYNLNPDEAVSHFSSGYEKMELPTNGGS
jgi:hypothetical protein